MKKTAIAILVFVPAIFLSGCVVSEYPNTNYYAVGYSPGWDTNYYSGYRWGGGYYNNGWGGGFHNRGWGSHGGFGHHGRW